MQRLADPYAVVEVDTIAVGLYRKVDTYESKVDREVGNVLRGREKVIEQWKDSLDPEGTGTFLNASKIKNILNDTLTRGRRRRPRNTVVVSGAYKIECSFRDVDKELEYICKIAKVGLLFCSMVKSWRNPFATARWIHVRCHPFEDGNGRMAGTINKRKRSGTRNSHRHTNSLPTYSKKHLPYADARFSYGASENSVSVLGLRGERSLGVSLVQTLRMAGEGRGGNGIGAGGVAYRNVYKGDHGPLLQSMKESIALVKSL
ncbi:hypothetical protein M413DRAFT_14222 [Hebeloma cylindrosporum]|uniref:Fido domain-containing protein n=1 Tax=Hebeloma cylindrosporum TaxID=76867 RepID=A0A0C3BX21_HEBCY|nr:hypothetical protein M413DRAFT_14222 [Hebeloma cylindrosporum h7]